MKKIIIHSCFLAIFACFLSCKTRQPATAPLPPVQLSERLEKITMTDLKGQPFTLHKFNGKAVFLNFWATWCKPCINEMASMETLYQQYKNDIVFLAVTTEDLAKIKSFRQQQNLSFDFARLDITYLDAYVIKLPTTLLINHKGELVQEEEGMRIWTQYNNLEKIKALVKR
ncbi:MAG: TlpA family protein disulfide reductase [Bacteroidetes bacterium]|nr:MAG: TlpA family protein disulfide reductase [Bacteroidota bacterium]